MLENTNSCLNKTWTLVYGQFWKYVTSTYSTYAIFWVPRIGVELRFGRCYTADEIYVTGLVAKAHSLVRWTYVKAETLRSRCVDLIHTNSWLGESHSIGQLQLTQWRHNGQAGTFWWEESQKLWFDQYRYWRYQSQHSQVVDHQKAVTYQLALSFTEATSYQVIALHVKIR